MPASTALLTDIGTLKTNGPSANTKAASIAANGPIQDYPGNVNGVQLRLQSAQKLLTLVLTDTINSDDSTNRNLILGVLAALNGTSSPSVALITDLQTVYNSGPSANSKAAAIAANGPILDYSGNIKNARRMLEEANVALGILKTDTNAGDDGANLTLINNLLLALV